MHYVPSMRAFLILMTFASPAAAWEFSASPVCTLSSDQGVTVTYDGALYEIALTRAGGWPDAPLFSMRFDPSGPFISTPRHQVEGDTLTVTDTGFGNVLAGLENNQSATAILGDLSIPIDLNGAADPTRAFRECEGTPLT